MYHKMSISRTNLWNESVMYYRRPNSKTIDDLPNELLLEIFSYVPVEDIVKGVENVCCRWKLLVKDDSLWKHLVYRPTNDYGYSKEVISVLSAAPQLRWFVGPSTVCFSQDSLLETVSKLCKNLRAFELWIKGSSQFMVETFVRECKHIEKLTVHDVDFSVSWGLEVVSKCSNLKSLILDGHAFSRNPNIFLEISDGCPSLESLDLKNMIHYDIDDLENLLSKKKGRITSIALQCCNSQGCALPIVFKHCRNLELLDITRHIGDLEEENLIPLQKLPLKTLCMTYADGHNIVKYFENGFVQKLVKLDLSHCRNFDRRLANLIFENCTYVKYLNLQECTGLTSDCLESISNLKYLEYLNLDHCFRITDSGVQHIVKCKFVKDIVMNYCEVSNKGFALCVLNLKMLRMLLMKNCIVHAQDLLKVPENLIYLRTLSVSFHDMEDPVIYNIKKRMPDLEIFGGI